tara:strand:+ start:3729 stop:4871 length:1143 start_codon:yes stop_codon:yes gene_type:complete
MLALLIICAKRLDLYSFGILSTALIIIQFAYIISEWGFSIDSIKNFESKKNLYYPKFFNLITNCKIILFLGFLICFLIFSVFSQTVDIYQNRNLYVATVLAIFFATFNNLWFYQALNKTNILIFPTLIGRIIALGTIYYFLHDADDIFFVPLSQAISFAIPTIFGYTYAFNKLGFRYKFGFLESFKKITSNFNIFITTLFQNQIHSLWGLLLILIGNPIQIALFNLVDQFVRSGNALSTLLPEVIITNKKSMQNINKTFISTILAIIFTSFCLFLSLEFIVEYLFGEKFIAAIPILKLSLFSLVMIAIIKIIGYPLIGELYSYSFFNKISRLFALSHIVLIIILYKFFLINAYIVSIAFLTLTILYFICLIFFVIKKKYE